MFSSWTKGGACPYDIAVERKHFFDELKEHYNGKSKRIKDRDLIIMICKEKKWKIQEQAKKV